jgi:23S rRNA (pseudouridine1915-N3)-methyltransferase
MYQIDIITIGDLPHGAFQEIRAEYQKFLGKYTTINHRVIKDDADLLARVNPDSFLVVLEATGKNLTSEAFANTIKQKIDLGQSITFVIGGAHGLSPEIKASAHLLLSLSAMTTTHDLAQLFFYEQLFRTFTIIHGTGYHK